MSIARMIAGAGFSTAWNISAARYVRFFSVGGVTGVFFRPDGQEMFVTEKQESRVSKYALSSPWDVSSATFSQAYTAPPGSNLLPDDIFFKPDGTRMYIVKSDTFVEAFNLSTPWDLSEVSSLADLNVQPTIKGLFIKPDGTKLYVSKVISDDGTTRVNGAIEYSMSSPWNLSTASFSDSVNFSGSSRRDAIFFRQDGRKLYTANYESSSVDEYNLSTPWDINTLQLLQSLSVSSEVELPQGLFFRQDGTRMYVSRDAVHEYNLTSASRAASYRTAGTYTFVVPSAITSVTLSLVGGAGGGASGGTTVSGEKNPVTTNYFGGDGGSGASATKTLSVTPGESLTIVVGAGGAGGVAPGVENVGVNAGSNGTDSTVTQSASVVARADAGFGAPSTSDGAGGLASASTGDTTTNGVTGAGGAGGFGASQSGTAGVAGSVIITW